MRSRDAPPLNYASETVSAALREKLSGGGVMLFKNLPAGSFFEVLPVAKSDRAIYVKAEVSTFTGNKDKAVLVFGRGTGMEFRFKGDLEVALVMATFVVAISPPPAATVVAPESGATTRKRGAR